MTAARNSRLGAGRPVSTIIPVALSIDAGRNLGFDITAGVSASEQVAPEQSETAGALQRRAVLRRHRGRHLSSTSKEPSKPEKEPSKLKEVQASHKPPQSGELDDAKFEQVVGGNGGERHGHPGPHR